MSFSINANTVAVMKLSSHEAKHLYVLDHVTSLLQGRPALRARDSNFHSVSFQPKILIIAANNDFQKPFGLKWSLQYSGSSGFLQSGQNQHLHTGQQWLSLEE